MGYFPDAVQRLCGAGGLMGCEPCTYLPEPVADCLPTSSLDTRQLSLLSGSLTPAKSCENEPPMDGSQACECGKGMSGCSIHQNTPEAWTASMRASLARILALAQREGMRGPFGIGTEHPDTGGASWWEVESNVGRVADGVPSRVHRLKCLGNAQVPIQAATAWRLLGGE